MSGMIHVPVRKARWGWWVDGRWCPTERIRNFEVRQAQKRRERFRETARRIK